MARPGERIRLKDRIIDNISKAIKSIQELVYYQYKDPVLAGYDDGVVLYNSSHLCHKLCENLDHTLLHGLKNVMRGYWRVVRQLSPHAMVKEIEMLVNVTTDLGKGRAWLYASLNEGLLESYIRLLCDNDKLLKKYYAKEALVLDRDRMSVLLTLASGLDCVTFRLDYDMPYLDLNAYPPRSRNSSDQEADVSSDLPDSYLCCSSRNRSRSEVFADSPLSTFCQPSDSDSLSLASLDAHSHSDVYHMKVSTISADSGFPADSLSAIGTRQHSVTSSETVINTRLCSITPADSVSLSSISSSGDPDRHQRLENVVSTERGENGEGHVLEVIRITNKKCGGSKAKKKKTEQESFRTSHGISKPTGGNGRSQDTIVENNKLNLCIEDERKALTNLTDSSVSTNSYVIDSEKSLREKLPTFAGHGDIVTENNKLNVSLGGDQNSLVNLTDSSMTTNSYVTDSDSSVEVTRKNSPASESHDNQAISKSFSKCDSGVDICCLAAQSGKSSSSSADISDILSAFSINDKDITLSGSPHFLNNSEFYSTSAKNKSAELCYLDSADINLSQDFNPTKIKSGLNSSNTCAVPKSCIAHCGVNEPSDYPSDTRSSAVPFTPDKSDPREINSPANVLRINQREDKSIASYQSQLNENEIVSSYKKPCCDTQDGHISGKVIKLEENTEREGFNSSYEAEDADDFYSRSDPEVINKCYNHPVSSEALEGGICTVSHFEDNKDCILRDSGSPPPSDDRLKTEAMNVDMSLSLDNNTVLQLMLDVFTHENEQFLKMYVTWENHTEGGSGVAFVLVSDHCLYILHHQRPVNKFVQHSSTLLTDIIFISTGLNGQILNIESRGTNKQKQRLWLTPGNQSLSQSILACLADAVKSANEHISGKSRFSIGTEVPLQKIALRKYISKEIGCKPQDVTLWDYSLVYWEDVSPINSGSHNGVFKEGVLHLRTRDPVRGHFWKPVYVVLKNSMLCFKTDKHDPRPNTYLSLGGDQCVGCRVTSHAGHDNCVELILSEGRNCLLSAVSQAEISEWSHVLCLAVSQVTVEDDTPTSCIPCCAILSCNNLFLCHEDLYTKFYRTLGRIQLQDVAGISVDDADHTYCIIKLKPEQADVPNQQWVLYFYAAQDLERYKKAVSSAWKSIYKSKLPISPLDDVALQSYCRTNVGRLRQQLTMS